MNIRKLTLLLSLMLLSAGAIRAQTLKLALAVYGGGGDWYANPTALKNLATFCNRQLQMRLAQEEAQVELGSRELFNYPFVHLTGHGRWTLTTAEAENLRTYLEGGGFLHIDDNYGLDEYVRPAMKQVFPDLEFVEIPFSHTIYKQPFSFPNGLPKIHEHDNKPPRGYGIILNGRIVCFYTTETDLGDGWEDPEVHNNPVSVHMRALQMGANLVHYAFAGN